MTIALTLRCRTGVIKTCHVGFGDTAIKHEAQTNYSSSTANAHEIKKSIVYDEL